MFQKVKHLEKSIFSWSNPGLIIKKSKIHGFGVFALNDIKKGDILAVFGGYVMTLKELYQDIPRELQGYAIQISSNLVISIKDIRELDEPYHINHSCNPNAGYYGQIVLVAMRIILEGEEVTTDYAMDTCDAKGVKLYRMICSCGEENCRKIITGKDWKINRLQKKYKGYYQLYIEDNINRINIKNKKNCNIIDVTG